MFFLSLAGVSFIGSMFWPLPHPQHSKSRFDKASLPTFFWRFLVNRGALMVSVPITIAAIRVWFHYSGMPFSWLECLVWIGLIPWPLYETFVHKYEMHEWSWHPFYEPHHRHHAAPFDAEYGIVPTKVIVFYFSILFLFIYLEIPALLTFYFGVVIILTLYEWCHFLIHTSYRFKSSWGRAMYFNHRRHHWLDEDRYMGLLFPHAKEWQKAKS